MNYSKPRKCTVKKYTLYLKSMIIKINKYGELFSASKFREENPIPNNWFKYCEELQYISSLSNGNSKIYHPILFLDDINESHGLAIAEASLRYNINHSELYEKMGNRVVTQREKKEEKVKIYTELLNISTQELLKELKRRGYSGELTKSVLI